MSAVYMLRDVNTGLFYRRQGSHGLTWVPQGKASVWSNRVGPTSAKAAIKRDRYSYRDKPRPETELVIFDLVERKS